MCKPNFEIASSEGELLDVHPSDHIRLKPGQIVCVWLNRHFWFITDEEKVQMEEEARRQAEEEKERIRQRKNRLREEAETFNAALNIPVKTLVPLSTLVFPIPFPLFLAGTNRPSRRA